MFDAGEHDKSKHERQEQRFEVKNIFIHPKFDREKVSYDIALLKLKKKEKRTAYVNPVRALDRPLANLQKNLDRAKSLYIISPGGGGDTWPEFVLGCACVNFFYSAPEFRLQMIRKFTKKSVKYALKHKNRTK